jgi:hypothetical protein
MKTPATLLRIILLCLTSVSTACAGAPPVTSAEPVQTKVETRSCYVQEILKGGMYVYLRCKEKDKDIWLATVARDFKQDELVVFVNAPPMTDFYSKFLDRIFPEVIFTDLLPLGSNR